MILLLLKQSSKVSDEQLSLLITSAAEKLGNKDFWKNMTKVLNNKGPSIKTPDNWRIVCTIYKKKTY